MAGSDTQLLAPPTALDTSYVTPHDTDDSRTPWRSSHWAASRRPVGALFLLQQQRRLVAQYGYQAFRRLRQEPRQAHFNAQRVLQYLNARRGSLTERTHAKAQRIAFPSLVLDRDDPSELTIGADHTLLETPDRFGPAKIMGNQDCGCFAH
jgi:hypothetical protein